MTATERLRQLLDERGAEWGKALTDLSRQTHWSTERYWCAFTEWNGTVGIADTLTIYHISPEQAVDATLGRGTCEYVGEDADNIAGIVFRCSKCGNVEWPRPRNYCPECGRRVES